MLTVCDEVNSGCQCLLATCHLQGPLHPILCAFLTTQAETWVSVSRSYLLTRARVLAVGSLSRTELDFLASLLVEGLCDSFLFLSSKAVQRGRKHSRDARRIARVVQEDLRLNKNRAQIWQLRHINRHDHRPQLTNLVATQMTH
jgi:hypothetical protein